MKQHPPVYYGEYLALDKIIDAQHPVSFKEGNEPAHDEMLFIIIHQAYELWFKQILFEINAATQTMSKEAMDDNSADLQMVVHRLKRVTTILKVLVQQIDILETMTPMDFLDFRDMLRPASGFQSWQFKIIEAKLGLKFEQRYGQNYYTSQLKQAEIDIIKDAEAGNTVLALVNKWLERMPFFNDDAFWKNYSSAAVNDTPHSPNNTHPFWRDYENIYASGLAEAEQQNLQHFSKLFFDEERDADKTLSAAACRSALFIMIYRGYPMLELPFQLLDTLLEIDNQLGMWRYRHINMVRRMIGTRIGTGGSTGAGYLQGAMDKHYIFKEISQLNSFLIDRRKLPKLPIEITNKLGYL
ncbi:tryptophan 2,3-dioxygenase [Ferruginibacter yonginensis]|uniref:Tryptophan 2,3-dioxygenase n=1 Tax=Ferruginibacter yonginensis TaxID=1310416 RepID=A0ABV8QT77_9BACT